MNAELGVEHLGIEEHLRLHLLNDGDVGPAVKDRVWWLRLKPGAFLDTATTPQREITTPAITLFHVSSVIADTSDENATFVRSRYQVSIWGKRQRDVAGVANKVRGALGGFRGRLGGPGGPIVSELSVAMELDLAPERDTGILQHPIDFYVAFALPD